MSIHELPLDTTIFVSAISFNGGGNWCGSPEQYAPEFWQEAVDKYGFIYVSDSINDRIEKFTSEGFFITVWGTSDEHLNSFSCII